MPVYRAHERPQGYVGGDHEGRAKRAVNGKPGAGEQTHRRRTPQRRRRIEAADVEAFLENYAGAEKADAGDDLRADARHGVAVRGDARE